MNLYADVKLLQENLVSLVGNDDSLRQRAAAEIKLHVEQAARELSLDRFSRFELALYQQILNYVDAGSMNQRIGGILALKYLIDSTSATADTKILNFATSLSNTLSNCEDYQLITLATEALGHMAKNSPVAQVEYLETELVRSLSWLSKSSNSSHFRRFAACRVLQQLAQNASTIFFRRLHKFFDQIWEAIWDPKEILRIAASQALSACLAVLRERMYHAQWYSYIYDLMKEGFVNGTEEYVHGSMLVVTEILKYTGQFMIPRFKEVCKYIMDRKDHRSKLVRSAIISVLPSLAALCPDAFAREHLRESIDFLQKCSKIPDLRPLSTLSTGKLCLYLGTHLIDRIDELMIIIHDAFGVGPSFKKSSKSAKSQPVVIPEALMCVSDMVRGFGQPFHKYVSGLLEPMLQSGLTSELINTLNVICDHIPGENAHVQSRLLEEATKVLGGECKPPVVTPSYMYSWSKKGDRSYASMQNSEDLRSAFNRSASMRNLLSTSNSSLPVLPGTGSSAAAIAAAGNPGVASTSVSQSRTDSTMNKRKKLNWFSKSSSSTSHSKGTSIVSAGVAAIGMGLGLGSEVDTPFAPSPSHEIVLLSLRTLASLSIPPYNLVYIVQQTVTPYFNSDDYHIRKEAAITCAKMVSSLIQMSKSRSMPSMANDSSSITLSNSMMATEFLRGPTANSIEEIVSRILEVAVSDTSSQVRLGSLRSLGREFDRYLARPHHVQTLMLLFSDELFDVKLEALNLIGRLAAVNPASILPPVRAHLMRLISEMNCSPDPRMIEEAAIMLCNFMRFSKFHFLVRPVMSTILQSLPLYGDVRSTTAALETIGELSMVLQKDLLPYNHALLSVIITNSFDASSLKKQEVAMRTLGQYVKSTGVVVRPYLEYPHLLPRTLDLLCRNSASKPYCLRMEILRTIGLLGALEPFRYATILQFVHTIDKERKQASGMIGGDEKATTATSTGLMNLSGSNTDFRDELITDLEVDPFGSPDITLGLMSNSQRRNAGGNVEDGYNEVLIRTEALLSGDNTDSPASKYMFEQSVMRALPEPPQEKIIYAGHFPTDVDFYPRVALASLVKVLQEPSLNIHHSTATQTIIQIFSKMGSRCVPFLEQIFPYFLQIVRRSSSGIRESILQQISQLITITRQHIAGYMTSIVELLCDYWNEHLEYVLDIVKQLALSTADSFAGFLHIFLPMLLSGLSIPRELPSHSVTDKIGTVDINATRTILRPLEEILHCIKSLRLSIRPHLHLFIPRLCKLLIHLQEDGGLPTLSTQTLIVQTIRLLLNNSKGAVAEQCNVLCSVVVHTLCRAILKCVSWEIPPNSEFYIEAMLALVILAQQVGVKILQFDSLIQRTTDGRGFANLSYRMLIDEIRAGQWDESSYTDVEESSFNSEVSSQSTTEQDPTDCRPIHFQQLAKSWDVNELSTANDWYEWLWRFNIDLLRASPSSSLRACASLAQSYAPMARELFHAAFVSCWKEMPQKSQDSLVRALQSAFRNNTIPGEILQYLLNLAEYMEHDVEALPIKLSILAELAQKGHAYAKALHYREEEFLANTTVNSDQDPANCFENLININKKLDQYDAATGLLKVAHQIQKRIPQLCDVYKVRVSWLAKLGYWEEALAKYEESLQADPTDSKALAGQLKCLEALGRWEELCEHTQEKLQICSQGSVAHTKASVIGARAAWSLNQWKLMDSFVSQLPENNMDASFMKAVLAIHSENYEESAHHIEVTRRHLDKNISSLMTESYGRAYMSLITVQQCSELEEIIEFKIMMRELGVTDSSSKSSNANEETKRVPILKDNLGIPRRSSSSWRTQETISHQLASDNMGRYSLDPMLGSRQSVEEEVSRRKMALMEKWRSRIRGCCSTGRAAIPYWKYLLNARRMVVSESEDLDTWLDFAALCRHGGNSALAERVLASMTLTHTANSGSPQDIVMKRRIELSILKQKWDKGEKTAALEGLEKLISESPHGLDNSYLSCLLKLGEWKIAILGPSQPVNYTLRKDVLDIYERATKVDTNSYRAYHQWGLCNYRLLEEVRGRTAAAAGKKKVNGRRRSIGPLSGVYHRGGTPANADVEFSKNMEEYYAVRAVEGLMRALQLGTRRFSSSVMQDMLCILSVWFRYGGLPKVKQALEEGLELVDIDNWLGVLPQLIARIDHSSKESRELLNSHLMRLGAKHVQALVYPLSVAVKSPSCERKEAAQTLLNNLRKQNSKLIDQAMMVSDELIRVAISWEECWHWALEEASRQCFGEGNLAAMIESLLPLHELMDGGGRSIRETAFLESYQVELSAAHNSLKTYLRDLQEKGIPIPTTKESRIPALESPITHAWDCYYPVFKRINLQLSHVTPIDLPSCSSMLATAKNLDLGVPGTYCVDGTAVRIKSFSDQVVIIRSKQRPRILRMTGENGQEFVFLLKGHEDLRQDERAMQLFGLVNALLHHDRRTSTNGEDIQIYRYSVMPLSPSVGLIGWVPNCDTLHDLIRGYRDKKKIPLDIEHRLVLQVAPNKLYDLLPAMHKLEVFEHAMHLTTGSDFAKILWLKSESSETWLQRRATYIRSLAVMSMVGYILGLGDRHPSNLMLERKTGKILHIDFGDCFEVAKHRDKFPEKVPFRLTRMLVTAMEVAGIEGSYRSTCEMVMRVLRENRDSLVATLEAFVHDPLISWRLMNINAGKTRTPETTPASAPTPVITPAKPVEVITTAAAKSEENTNPVTAMTAEELRATAAAAAAAVEEADDIPSPPPFDSPNKSPRSRSRSVIAKSLYSRSVLPPITESDGAAEESEIVFERATLTRTNSGIIQRQNLSSSLLGSSLLNDPPVSSDAPHTPVDNLVSPLLTKGFADHSVADTICGSLVRSTVDNHVSQQNSTRENSKVPTSGKTVSFSLTNQTIDGDNTIRRSSVPVTIKSAESSEEISEATRAAASASISIVAPVNKSSLHVEFSSLANSLTVSRNFAQSLRSSGSVRSGFSRSLAISMTHPSVEPTVDANRTPSEDPITEEDVQTQDDPVTGAAKYEQELTEKAVVVIRRVLDKLTGLDFAEGNFSGIGINIPSVDGTTQALEVDEQVDRLIREATSNENLSQSFFGWCPFW